MAASISSITISVFRASLVPVALPPGAFRSATMPSLMGSETAEKIMGADSFALNGAFCGYGVDYVQLGQATAKMVADLLVNGADPASTPVRIMTAESAFINTETCEAIGMDLDQRQCSRWRS